MTNIPPAPPLPTQWTLHTTVAYVAGLAVFVLGILTASGVVFPASGEIKIVVGVVASVLGAFTTQVPMLVRTSLQKAALKAGTPVSEAAKL